MTTSRRGFIKAVTAGLATIPLTGLSTGCSGSTLIPRRSYGPLEPDASTVKVVSLPRGFSYRMLSNAGNRMTDGFYKPMNPASMGVFPTKDAQVVIVRNHDITPGGPSRKGPFGFKRHLLSELDPSLVYDVGGEEGKASLGGVTTLVYDMVTREVVRQHLSLAGTIHNRAGAATPWGTWLSCEASWQSRDARHEKDHGFCFEVPASASPAIAEPVPLRRMGRFPRGGLVVSPNSGSVYQTEAHREGFLYRFVPHERQRLRAGGTVQAIVAIDRTPLSAQRLKAGEAAIPVRWVDLAIDHPNKDLRSQGKRLQCATFPYGGPMCRHGSDIYFLCGRSPEASQSQVWRYRPTPKAASGESDGELDLVISFGENDALTSITDLSITPWGDLLVCGEREGEAYLAGATLEGDVYLIARSQFSGGYPFAGAVFGPGGRTLFVNVPHGGFTLAIEGPWYRRDLSRG